MWKSLLPLVALLSMGGCIVDGSRTYDPCVNDIDCNSTLDSCQVIASSTAAEGICTRACRDSLDCPVTINGFEPACVGLSTGGGLCFETCRNDLDCASGFRCDQIDSGDIVCIPD